MTSVCPTVTAYEPHEYREQIQQVVSFAGRIHIDLMDGVFTDTKSPSLDQIWLPEDTQCDVHLMYQQPVLVLPQLVGLLPSLIIIHAEADDAASALLAIKQAGIKAGIALLADTEVSRMGSLIQQADHVLIFSGHLGYHGGEADLSLVTKVSEVKQYNPHAEIGWDGGINDQNVSKLVSAGIEVLNVGGFVQNAAAPSDAYAKLLSVTVTS